MRKVVALCLLRLLPRGGSKFRTWFAKRVCKYEFERQTRSLRAWRVFMMRELETRKELKVLRGARAECPYTWQLREELRNTVEKAGDDNNFWEMIPLTHRATNGGRKLWCRWVSTIH